MSSRTTLDEGPFAVAAYLRSEYLRSPCPVNDPGTAATFAVEAVMGR